jgi:ADP-ribose pyrophosphatase YjhB (NUDIX family)
MKINTTGIILNEFAQILLIRRADSRTWAPPGGALESGELPDEGVAREVEEETGIKVTPVRLTAVIHHPSRNSDQLFFIFRCIQHGGELAISEESLQVGWYGTDPLPSPMLNDHRQRVGQAFYHQGGPPYWGAVSPSPIYRWGRRALHHLVYPLQEMFGETQFRPAPVWKLGAFTVIRNEAGDALWVKRPDWDVWNLPGGGAASGETPWATAVRETQEETGLYVNLHDLTGVYGYEEEDHLIFTFTGTAVDGELTPGPEAIDFAYFTPGQEPENVVQQHVARVADAVNSNGITVFKRQPGPRAVIGEA